MLNFAIDENTNLKKALFAGAMSSLYMFVGAEAFKHYMFDSTKGNLPSYIVFWVIMVSSHCFSKYGTEMVGSFYNIISRNWGDGALFSKDAANKVYIASNLIFSFANIALTLKALASPREDSGSSAHGK